MMTVLAHAQVATYHNMVRPATQMEEETAEEETDRQPVLFRDIRGKTFSPDDFKGKQVYVYFGSADNLTHIAAHLDSLRRQLKRKLVMLAFSPDADSVVKQQAVFKRFNYTVAGQREWPAGFSDQTLASQHNKQVE